MRKSKSDHLVLSIGVRSDCAPHQHIWCQYCGATQAMPIPGDINVVVGAMKGFNKSHKNCVADNMVERGYAKLQGHCFGLPDGNNKYVWDGMIGVEAIALNAFEVASKQNGLNEPYTPPAYDAPRAEACIHDMIMQHITPMDSDWFSINYSDLLGYVNMPVNSRDKNWPGIRFRLFLRVAYILIWSTEGVNSCKKL